MLSYFFGLTAHKYCSYQDRVTIPRINEFLGGLDEGKQGKMFGGVRCVAERTLDTILMVSIDVSRLCILVGSRISRGTVDS